MPNDSWINVFSCDDEHFVKMEYMTPFSFEIPEYVYKLFGEINEKYKCEKTVSLFRHDGDGLNFDVSHDGIITTMHNKMVQERIHNLLCDKKRKCEFAIF